MSELSDAARAQISAKFQSQKSALNEEIPQLSKAELLDVISGIDKQMEAAQADFVANLSDSSAALPASQIAELWTAVASARLLNPSDEQSGALADAMSAKVSNLKADSLNVGGLRNGIR